MARKGLPAQGSDAILKAMSEANEVMLKQKKDENPEDEQNRSVNEEIRKFVNNK